MGSGKKDIREIFSKIFKPKPKKTTEASAIKDTKSLKVKRLGIGLFKSSSEKNSWAAPEVDFQQIENAYLTDSYIRTAVDKHVDYMFKSGWSIVGKNQAAVDYVNQRLRIMEIGTGQLFEQMLNEMAEDVIKYHNIFIGKARKSGYPFPSGIKAVPLDGLQPITGYFCLPTVNMEITRDPSGEVKKYRQKVQGDSEKELKQTDVIHITVDRPPGRAFGLPYLWEVLDDVKVLRQLEELTDRMVYKNIFPLIAYQVGLAQDGFQSDDDEIEEVKEYLGQLELDGGLVIPERHNIKSIDINPMDVRPYLDYFEQRVFTGLGVSAVLMGRGNTANRSTSDTLDSTFRDRVKGYQNTIATSITRFMFQDLLTEGGFDPIMNPDDEVRFEFKEIDFDSKIKQENHTVQKFTQNAITYEEMRAELGLEPTIDESRLYFNMITASLGAQKAESANQAANNQGDNKNKPANQSGKKTSPGKPQTRKDSYGSKPITESTDIIESINNKYNLLKESVLSDMTQDSIHFYELRIKSSISSIILSTRQHVRDSYSAGKKDLSNEVGKLIPDYTENNNSLNDLNAKIERHFTRLLEKDILSNIETIIKETRDISLRKQKTSIMFEANKYRVGFILRSEYTKAYNIGYLNEAKNNGFEKFEVIGSENCGICKEHVGKIYHVEEINDNNLPPYHTNCTCKIKVRY